MTTTTRRHQTTSSGFFKWRSLKTRVTIFTLTFFLIGIWSLALYSRYTLHDDMEQALGEQQFSTVSIMAADINAELDDRLRSLEKVAARITPAILGNATAMQAFLEERVILQSLFDGGTAYRLDGTAIAEVPLSTGRVGINYADRDYIVGPLREGKVTIGKPYLSTSKKSPEFNMAVPIRDTQGKTIGALAVVIDLGKPGFLDKITKFRYGKSGGYFLVAPQYRMIVTASDKSRIMQQLPAPGVNPAMDRFIQGYEGFDVYVNPLGVEVLASGKSIPVAGWVMGAILPTVEAFAPVHAMQQRILIAAIFLTLLLGCLTWWMLKRQLAPIFTTIKTLATLSDTDQHPQPLPITRQDEIGELIGSFNRLLETLGHREGELRESGANFRKEHNFNQLLLDTSPAFIVAIGFDGKTMMMNKALLDSFEYTTEEIEGADYLTTFVPEEDREMLAGVFQNIVREGKANVKENRIISRSGRTYLVEWHGRPVIQEGVDIDIFVGIGIDITDRKQAEEALRESEERYRTLIESTRDLIYTTDRKGFLTYMNPTLERTLGYAPHEWNGKTFGQIVAPECIDSVKDLFKRAMKGESIPAYSVDLIRKDGTRLSVEFNVTTTYDSGGKPSGRYGIGRDITDRKRAEEALKKSERNLSDIVEFLPDATFVIDLEGKVIAWNRAIEEMTGILKEGMIGQGDHAYAIPFYGERRRQLLDLIDLSDKELESKYKSVQRKGNTLYAEAFTPALYGGKGAHVWATGASLFDDSGNRVGAIESIRDVTEHKQAEEEKRSLEGRLQRAEKMESLGTLAGGVAHDLNNVLGIMVGYAELVLMKVDESSSIRPQLVNIMNGGLKAAAIVDDLLTLARRGVSDRDVLNLNKIIADCQHSPEFEKLYSYHPSVKIKIDLDPDMLNISGSSVHLGKSLYNLVSNASEAMPKGGTVTIKTTNQYLDKPILGYDQIREGDYVVLTVSDTGEGIKDADLKRIFEPFYTKKVMGRSGTGLGLSVVWGTVKDHNGYINVESEEGKGSTFTLYFPVTMEGITAEAVAVDISEYMGNGESILVVDDVREQRDLAAGMLRTLNYNVASVSSGEEAIAYMRDHQADLIVLDMIMDPGMDGLDTYKGILEIHPRQKAIIVSGFSETDRVRAAKSLGAGAYVRKPYIKEKLGVVVKNELDKNK